MKSKPIKHSFASIKLENGTMEFSAYDVAKVLSKNWGDIPRYINDTRAFEIHCLAKAYLILRRKLRGKATP